MKITISRALVGSSHKVTSVSNKFVYIFLAEKIASAWTLNKLTAESLPQLKTLMDAGEASLYVDLLLSNPNPDVQEESLLVLGTIASDSISYCEYLLNAGVMGPLWRILNTSERLTTIRNGVWLLSNLCKGKNSPADFSKFVDGLYILGRLLDNPDYKVLCDTCWTISYLSNGREQIQFIIETGVCHRLVELMTHTERGVSIGALRAVGNIVTGDDQQTQVILGHNALASLSQLLRSSSERICRESCWIISNIAAGNNPEHIQALIDATIFPQLLEMIKGSEYRTSKEILRAIANATNSGTLDQIAYLVRIGCIPIICEFLFVSDSSLVLVSLKALESILKAGESYQIQPNPYALVIEECGGLDKVEYLQSHENLEIYHHSFNLIGQYFGEDEDVRMAPLIGDLQYELNPQNVPNGGYNF